MAAVTFAALPFITLIIWVIVWVLSQLVADIHRHQQWMASLTAEQRGSVILAEAAAAIAAASESREHQKRLDARLTASVMGYTMPDGVTPRPTDLLRTLHEEQMRRDILQAQHDELTRANQIGQGFKAWKS